MRNPMTPPRRIAIASHPSLPAAAREADLVAELLGRQNLQSLACGSLYDPELRQRIQNREFDVLIALGGDGTMLRAGQLCAPWGVPVLGINLGSFGFLIEVQQGDWHNALPLLLQGKYRLEDRMILHAEHQREGAVLNSWTVINEVVVCRGKIVRPIRVTAHVDGHLMASYVADGLIISTATGSMAYALAAGGPIMPPELRNVLIIPLAPHLSMDRAVILEEGVRVKVTVHTDHEAVISPDGHTPEALLSGDVIEVASHDQPVTFIRFQDAGYFYTNLTKYMERNPTAGMNA